MYTLRARKEKERGSLLLKCCPRGRGVRPVTDGGSPGAGGGTAAGEREVKGEEPEEGREPEVRRTGRGRFCAVLVVL